MTPFDASEGTVWEYKGSDAHSDFVFVVLSGYRDVSSHAYRRYFNLTSGEICWFAKDSWVDTFSESLA